MKTTQVITRCKELNDLCSDVRKLVQTGSYDKCEELIFKAMVKYPNAPQPHNLLGVILEKVGNHTEAMKHFRASWALDSTYAPACENLSAYGTIHSRRRCAYDESDCK